MAAYGASGAENIACPTIPEAKSGKTVMVLICLVGMMGDPELEEL